MNDLFDLSGRTALVTGSSRGIGEALARALLSAGATVVIHGRDRAAADATAARLAGETGGTALVATFDVTDTAAVDAGITELTERSGPLDILVNNAGVQRRAPITEFTDADWELLISTNLTSAFLLSRRVAADMVAAGPAAGGGARKIVNIGSVQSQLARPGITPYSATKGAIVMLTRGLCADLAPQGVCVNGIAPGYFATELTSALVADET